jgi:rod shape-determining protein MreD
MFIRILIPLIAVILFLLESTFAMFSPIELGGHLYTLVPRFLILYLIFLAIYYSKKRAMIYALIFGILVDVFYINIVGLYSVIYPLMCFIAGWCVKRVHPNLIFSTGLAILLMGVIEFLLYQFFFAISFTALPLQAFIFSRLIPTILANLLFLIMLGWAFQSLIRARVLQHAQNNF